MRRKYKSKDRLVVFINKEDSLIGDIEEQIKLETDKHPGRFISYASMARELMHEAIEVRKGN